MANGLIERINHQVFGLALMTATALVMVVVTVLLLDPSEVGTAAVLSVVLGATTFLVWRFQRVWAVVVGLLVTLGAFGTIFFIAFGIFQPLSPIEFVSGLLLFLGFVFALVGGIRALFRRGEDAPGSPRLRLGALALIGLGAVVSTAGFLLTRTSVDTAVASDAVVVDMKDFGFDPEVTTVPAGGKLLLTNSDAFAHDFTLEDYDLYTYFGPGSDALVDISELPPGTYDYTCSLHFFDGEGMSGTLTVEG